MPLYDSQDWTVYVDIDEIKAYLQWPEDAQTTLDPILQRFINMSCSMVQRYINRYVAPTTLVERHDGWSGDTIMVNWFPIVETVSVQEFQTAGGILDLSESTPDNPIDGFICNPLIGEYTRVTQGMWPRPFFPGDRNIQFTYVAGYNPIPDDIWVATAELVKWWWVNTQQMSVMSKQVSYGADDTSSGLWQGVPYRITALLNPFRRVVIG